MRARLAVWRKVDCSPHDFSGGRGCGQRWGDVGTRVKLDLNWFRFLHLTGKDVAEAKALVAEIAEFAAVVNRAVRVDGQEPTSTGLGPGAEHALVASHLLQHQVQRRDAENRYFIDPAVVEIDEHLPIGRRVNEHARLPGATSGVGVIEPDVESCRAI
ncbi:hypothetical protein D3C78_519020 [compost metagenome]